jgi:osmotically-inducible protein OsmY
MSEDVNMRNEIDRGEQARSAAAPVRMTVADLTVKVEQGDLSVTARMANEATLPAHTAAELLELHAALIVARKDLQIALAAAAALREMLPWSNDCAQLIVRDGAVTVAGDLQWQYQRSRILDALAGVAGVAAIRDHTALNPTISTAEIEYRLQQAMIHHA